MIPLPRWAGIIMKSSFSLRILRLQTGIKKTGNLKTELKTGLKIELKTELKTELKIELKIELKTELKTGLKTFHIEILKP